MSLGDSRKMLKEDLNFLDFPLWVKGMRGTKIKNFKMNTHIGTYEIKSAENLPVYFDQKVFYFLLHKLYVLTSLNNRKITISRHEIAVAICGMWYNTEDCKRIMQSLKIWVGIVVNFEGIFFDGIHYKTVAFHIIESYKLDAQENMLSITFNEEYLNQLKHSKSFKLIDFNIINMLSSDSSLRLYELFCKAFADTKEWHTTQEHLFLMLSIKTRKYKNVHKHFFSDLLECIETGLKELNATMNFTIAYVCDKKAKTFIFKLITPEPTFKPAPTNFEERQKYKEAQLQEEVCKSSEYYQALSDDQKKDLEAAIEFDRSREMGHRLFVPGTKKEEKIITLMKRKGLWGPARNIL
jgi:hypothetical protein